MAKDKEIKDSSGDAYSSSSVDRLYLELVNLGLIERKAHCWSCKKPISTEGDKKCPKCNAGIICTNENDQTGKECGKCVCQNPKKKK